MSQYRVLIVDLPFQLGRSRDIVSVEALFALAATPIAIVGANAKLSVNTNTIAVTWRWFLPFHLTSSRSRSLQRGSCRISDLLANKECCTGRTLSTNLKMRDPAHALRIAVKHKLHRDYVCCEVWNEVFNKRHALVPDIMNSTKWQRILRQVQTNTCFDPLVGLGRWLLF